MKRTLLLTLGLLLVVAGPAAAGICLELDGFCNHVYLSNQAMSGMTEVHGYEYGCGARAREVAGTFYKDGDFFYFGLVVSSGLVWDTGSLGSLNYIIDARTLTGTQQYFYTYLTGGLIGGHGGSVAVNGFSCSDPGFPLAASGVDAATHP